MIKRSDVCQTLALFYCKDRFSIDLLDIEKIRALAARHDLDALSGDAVIAHVVDIGSTRLYSREDASTRLQRSKSHISIGQ